MKTRWLGALPLGLSSGTMRTNFACTERVTICPRYSPETFLNVPILAMMLVLSLARAAPARPRCASVVSKGPVPQPSGPQRSGGRPWSVFLVSRGTAARRGKKVGQGRCGVPDQRSGLLTDGAFREAVLRSEEHKSE